MTIEPYNPGWFLNCAAAVATPSHSAPSPWGVSESSALPTAAWSVVNLWTTCESLPAATTAYSVPWGSACINAFADVRPSARVPSLSVDFDVSIMNTTPLRRFAWSNGFCGDEIVTGLPFSSADVLATLDAAPE